MAKRYLTFVSFLFEGGPSWQNFEGSFDNYESAKAHVVNETKTSMVGEVVDLEIERVVFKIKNLDGVATIENLAGLERYA